MFFPCMFISFCDNFRCHLCVFGHNMFVHVGLMNFIDLVSCQVLCFDYYKCYLLLFKKDVEAYYVVWILLLTNILRYLLTDIVDHYE